MKKWSKIEQKNEKNEEPQKNGQEDAPGDDFFRKTSVLGWFWNPWEVPWEGLGQDFGRKIWRRKKSRTTCRQSGCLGGWHVPQQGGIQGGFPGGARSNTPSLILTDGRADCLRFASPAEATWRLEALRLWVFEALANQETKTKNTKAHKTRTRQEIEILHQI